MRVGASDDLPGKTRSVPRTLDSYPTVRPGQVPDRDHEQVTTRMRVAGYHGHPDGTQPFGQCLPSPVLRRVGDELCIVAGMSFQRIRLLIAAAQLLLRKLADGLVHAVAPVLGISCQRPPASGRPVRRVLRRMAPQVG
jgi:hypothetical protein